MLISFHKTNVIGRHVCTFWSHSWSIQWKLDSTILTSFDIFRLQSFKLLFIAFPPSGSYVTTVPTSRGCYRLVIMGWFISQHSEGYERNDSHWQGKLIYNTVKHFKFHSWGESQGWVWRNGLESEMRTDQWWRSRDLILWVSSRSRLSKVSRLRGLGLAQDYSISRPQDLKEKNEKRGMKKALKGGRFPYP